MAGKPTKGGLMSSRIKSANVKFFPEAVLGYLGGPFFALIPNGIINVFLTQYWVNVLGLGENADMFTWMLPLFSSIFIVIGSLPFGREMKTLSKWTYGPYLPSPTVTSFPSISPSERGSAFLNSSSASLRVMEKID